MSKPITLDSIFENAGYMVILKTLFGYEGGLEFKQLVYLLVGKDALKKLLKDKKGYLSQTTIRATEEELNKKTRVKHPPIEPACLIKSQNILSQRLRLLMHEKGLNFVEKEGEVYKLTKRARSILSIKWRLDSLFDTAHHKDVMSVGDITVYPDPIFFEKYHESKELKVYVDRILKDMEKPWKELRTLIFDSYKDDRKNTIEYYKKCINDHKFLEGKLKNKTELSVVLKEFRAEIKQQEVLIKTEPQTITIINPFGTPSKEDFFKFTWKTLLEGQLSDVLVYSICDVEK